MNYVEDLVFLNFNTSEPGIYQRECNSAFSLWDSQWKETFKKANWPVDLYSEEFRHRELGGVFLGTRAIGFLLYTFIDFSQQSHQHSSYFKNYPREVFKNHCDQQDRVMVPTLMTLDPAWKKAFTNLPVSELLFSFSVLRFLESSADRMIAYARNDLKMNQGFYRHGAVPVAQNVDVHGTLVDFIQISRQQAHLSIREECGEMALMLWNKTRTQTNPRIQTRIQKREGKNHVINLYQQENGTNHSSPERSTLGEQNFLPGLARSDLLLHPLQHSTAGLGSRLVTK